MRLKDKFVCLILISLLCTLYISPAFAENDSEDETVAMYLNTNLDNEVTDGHKPLGFKLVNSGETGRTAVVDLGYTKAFRIMCNSTVGQAGLVGNISPNVTGDVIIGNDFCIEDNTPCGKSIVITSSDKTNFTPVNIVEGELRVGATRIMGLAIGKFYRIDAAIHFDKGTMDLYVDGKKRLVNYKLPATTTDMYKIQWQATAPQPKDGSFMLDNIEVYASDKPLPPEKLYVVAKAYEVEVPDDAVSDEDVTKAAAPLVGFYINKPAALVKGEASYINRERTARPYYDGDTSMLPVRFMAENLGGSVSYNAEKNCVSVSINGKTAEFVYGQSAITVDATQKSLTVAPVNKGGVGYVPAKAFCENLGISLFEGKGLILCSLVPITLNWEKDAVMLNAFCERFLYDDVLGREITALVKGRYAQNQHPRLIFSNEDFKYMRDEIAKGRAGNADVIALYETAKREADVSLKELPFAYNDMDAEDLFAFGYNTDVRLLSLALMYNLTGDMRYAIRCRQELTAVSSYENWHPLETADTGRMASAVALAYDWIYDTLSELDHRLIKNAIVTKGISQLINDYDGETISGLDRKDVLQRIWMWNSPYAVNYWRFAVAGVGVSALAIIDELEGEDLAMAERVLSQCLKDARPAMGLFVNEMNSAEIEKCCRYYSLMIASYISATGSDFGFADSPDVTAEKTGISQDGAYDGVKILNIALAAKSDTTKMDVPDGEAYEKNMTDDVINPGEEGEDEYFTEEDLYEEEEQYDEDEQTDEDNSSEGEI